MKKVNSYFFSFFIFSITAISVFSFSRPNVFSQANETPADSIGHTFETAISYLVDNDIVQGYSDGTFKPDKMINRAEFTKIIIRTLLDYDPEKDTTASGSYSSADLPFSDIRNGEWYIPYIRKAVKSNIISGYPDGTFRPANPINLAEALKIIANAAGIESSENDTGIWYQPYAEPMQEKHYIPQTFTSFEQYLTRGEMAEMVWRVVEDIQNHPFVKFVFEQIDKINAQPSAEDDFSLPDGKLVYHRYSHHSAADSELFIIDFPSKKISGELGKKYGLCSPMNGSFSPDGTKLAVMAMYPINGSCASFDLSKRRSYLEVYILDLNSTKKTRVTNNSLPDEDPHFMPDGKSIVFKHAGHLAKWVIGNDTVLKCSPDTNTTGAYCYHSTMWGDQSKPTPSDDGLICYSEDNDNESDIYCFDEKKASAGTNINDIKIPVAATSGVEEYYPVLSSDYVYYASESPNKIKRKSLDDLSGKEETAAFCTNPNTEYSDPWPVTDNIMIFSSNDSGMGQYDLFYGDFNEEIFYSLDDIIPGLNTSEAELGAEFWIAKSVSSTKQFVPTTAKHTELEDLEAVCEKEVGADYRVADWNDIKTLYGDDIQTFVDLIGLTTGEGYSMMVTNGGQGFWYSSRHYFITRFDHSKPSHYLAHENIDNHYLDLGSWYGLNKRVLCYKDTASSASSFYDDFSGSLSKWNLFGNPSPKTLSSVKNKSGVFDNNGDSWCSSGVVSSDTFDLSSGVTLESSVYLDASNQAGCWAEASIGFKKTIATSGDCKNENYTNENGLSYNFAYDGDACWAAPAETRRHAWLRISYQADDGTTESMAQKNADSYINGWHTMKVVINADHIPSFYMDSTLIYTGTKKLAYSALSKNRVYLGERSSGSAGKAYHDWVRLSM